MFGLENISPEAIAQDTKALAPLFQDVENRAGGILHGILDRLNGTKITIVVEIPPLPKAEAVE